MIKRSLNRDTQELKQWMELEVSTTFPLQQLVLLHIEEQHMMNSQLEHAISLCLLGFILIRTFQSAVMLHAPMTAIGGLVSWNVLKMQMLRLTFCIHMDRLHPSISLDVRTYAGHLP